MEFIFKNTFKLIFANIMIFILCFLSGLCFFDIHFSWIIISLILSPILYFFSIFIHELGHYYYGKKTGYEFASFRVAKFIIYKKNNKLKFEVRKKIQGILGQCVMTPTNNEYELINKGGYRFNLYVITFSVIIYIILFIF